MKVNTFLMPGALVVVGFGLGIIGYGVGLGVGDNSTQNASATSIGDPANSTQSVSATSIGDPASGRELFVSQGCSMCHQFEGQGGEDAPPLDFMTGNLTATDIALMTGRIWNHVPAMKAAFEAEGIPFPTFQGNEMPDLIAYLHGGGPTSGVMDGGGSTSGVMDGGGSTSGVP